MKDPIVLIHSLQSCPELLRKKRVSQFYHNLPETIVSPVQNTRSDNFCALEYIGSVPDRYLQYNRKTLRFHIVCKSPDTVHSSCLPLTFLFACNRSFPQSRYEAQSFAGRLLAHPQKLHICSEQFFHRMKLTFYFFFPGC